MSKTHYEGKGGSPISSLLLRTGGGGFARRLEHFAHQLPHADSRMMIRRNVQRRVSALADFLAWDADPYLVLTGRWPPGLDRSMAT